VGYGPAGSFRQFGDGDVSGEGQSGGTAESVKSLKVLRELRSDSPRLWLRENGIHGKLAAELMKSCLPRLPESFGITVFKPAVMKEYRFLGHGLCDPGAGRPRAHWAASADDTCCRTQSSCRPRPSRWLDGVRKPRIVHVHT